MYCVYRRSKRPAVSTKRWFRRYSLINCGFFFYTMCLKGAVESMTTLDEWGSYLVAVTSFTKWNTLTTLDVAGSRVCTIIQGHFISCFSFPAVDPPGKNTWLKKIYQKIWRYFILHVKILFWVFFKNNTFIISYWPLDVL